MGYVSQATVATRRYVSCISAFFFYRNLILITNVIHCCSLHDSFCLRFSSLCTTSHFSWIVRRAIVLLRSPFLFLTNLDIHLFFSSLHFCSTDHLLLAVKYHIFYGFRNIFRYNLQVTSRLVTRVIGYRNQAVLTLFPRQSRNTGYSMSRLQNAANAICV